MLRAISKAFLTALQYAHPLIEVYNGNCACYMIDGYFVEVKFDRMLGKRYVTTNVNGVEYRGYETKMGRVSKLSSMVLDTLALDTTDERGGSVVVMGG